MYIYLLFVIRLGMFTNMDKEIEKLFHITKCNYNDYWIFYIECQYIHGTYLWKSIFQRSNWNYKFKFVFSKNKDLVNWDQLKLFELNK